VINLRVSEEGQPCNLADRAGDETYGCKELLRMKIQEACT